ncbi:energy transducer TonB [Rhodocaloribacter sp.]|jgi:protein TonB
MALRKTEKADLRRRYPLYIEIGLVLTLALLIVAFRLDLSADDSFEVVMQEQEVVQMEEVQQTQQIEKPPPPPRPPVPVEVPDDEILEDDDLDLDASLDIDEPLADLPPPPPPAEKEEEPEPEIFVIVEDMPQLIGGLGSLQKKIRYPEIAKKAGVEGRVIVQFVVDEQGRVVDPVVVRGIGAGCDEEAIRAVSQARFKPGKQRGKPVKVKMSLPITFKLK